MSEKPNHNKIEQGDRGEKFEKRKANKNKSKCTPCKGSGKKDGKTCPICKGKGYVEES